MSVVCESNVDYCRITLGFLRFVGLEALYLFLLGAVQFVTECFGHYFDYQCVLFKGLQSYQQVFAIREQHCYQSVIMVFP